MARVYVFDDSNSMLHVIIGLAIPVIAKKWTLLALLLFWLFVLYEAYELESPVSTIGDLVEFLVGVVMSLIILI